MIKDIFKAQITFHSDLEAGYNRTELFLKAARLGAVSKRFALKLAQFEDNTLDDIIETQLNTAKREKAARLWARYMRYVAERAHQYKLAGKLKYTHLSLDDQIAAHSKARKLYQSLLVL